LSAQPRVLVTGATGFIGRHLTAALGNAGYEVQGVVRNGAAAPEVDKVWPSLGLISGDLAGVDTVFHLAGLAHAGARGAERQALFNVNVDQTVNLYRQAVQAGVRRFVWLSSIKVLGDSSEQPLTIAAPYAPGDDYAASKTAAEKQLLAESGGATRLCIVRPPLVYGVGVQANFLSMLRYALGGWPLPLKSARAPRAWLSVHNLVDFLMHLAQAEALAERSIWHIRDAEETPVTDMLERMARCAGRHVRQWPLPPGVGMALAGLLGKRDVAARLFLPLQVDMSETQSSLHWQPPMPQQQAIEEVVAWYMTL